MHIKTITLQHGNISSLKNQWAITASQSNYWLANNRFSVDEAKAVDYHGKMIEVGFYSFVNKPSKKKDFCETISTMGLFVDGDIVHEDNLRAIRVMNDYCQQTNKRLKVKLHPTCDIEEYRKTFSDYPFIEFYGTEISVDDFCDIIDVAIIRNSATLTQALQYGVPSYIINDKLQKIDTYKNVKILKFSNAEQLYEILDKRQIDQIKDDLLEGQKYFCCEGDITNNYRKAFVDLNIISSKHFQA